MAQPLIVAVALAFVVRATMRIYSIPSASMTPTFSVGDHILATPYRPGHPERGDVVVFHSPASAGELAVKRVVAIPGDLIEGVDGRVRIGGRTLSEPYLRDRTASGNIAPQLIPSGCVFVMGDNRAESVDSRHWGVLPEKLIVGRARMVLWSSAD